MPLNPQPAKEAASRAFCAFNLAVFTIPAETAGDTINVGIVLKDARGHVVAGPVVCDVFLSDAATGLGITGTAATSAIAIGTNGYILDTLVTEKMVRVQTDALGRVDLNIIQSADVVTYYMVVVFPDGSIGVSGAITFAT